MTVLKVLLSWLLLVSLAWGQTPRPSDSPTVTPTATPTSSATPTHEGQGERGDFKETYRPSAQETDKPAVFGYMILARQELMEGTPTSKILRQSIAPWLLSALLLPIYWFLARRRGFRI